MTLQRIRDRTMAGPFTGRRLGLVFAATCAMALAVPASIDGTANAQTKTVRIKSKANGADRIKLGLNKSLVVDLPQDAYDILVANPAVADAVTRTSRRIYLFGKQVGETNIFVFGPNGEQIASLDLAIERDVSGLEEYLKRFIKNSDIKVGTGKRQRRAHRHRGDAARLTPGGTAGKPVRQRR